MRLYKQIKATIEEGGFSLLFRKIWQRSIVGYDDNFFLHPMPKGLPSGDLKLVKFTVGHEHVALAERILRAYRKASVDEKRHIPEKTYDDAWDDNRKTYHDKLLKILDSGDSKALANYLSDMYRRKSTYGISASKEEFERIESSSNLRKRYYAMLKDHLTAFAEAVGFLPYETAIPYVAKKNIYTDPDTLVAGIEDKLGIKIVPPQVDGGLYELGLEEGGLAFRDLWCLCAAWRVSEVVGKDAPIGEIGAGLGKAALYAYRFGFRDYSLFDLPIMNVMSAWYLGTALPDVRVALYGESDSEAVIRILPYWEFANKKFDLVLNQDSFPEINREIVEQYLRDIKRSSYLLSINHEHQAPLFPGADNNNLLVPEVVKEIGGFERISRFPCWIRKGYVEELYKVV